MKIKLLFLSFFVCISVFAQVKPDSTKPVSLILKTTPSYIFDFDNTFTIGIEKFYKKTNSVQFEFGYGNSNQNLLVGITTDGFSNNREYRNFDNFRTKIEFKRYNKRKKENPLSGMYTAVEFFGKFIRKNEYLPVGKNTINNQPEYTENVLSRFVKNVGGTHVKIGQQFYIFNDSDTKKSRILIDAYFGIGFRYIDIELKYPDKKPTDQLNSGIETFGGFFGDNTSQVILSATAGFKLGYVLR